MKTNTLFNIVASVPVISGVGKFALKCTSDVSNESVANESIKGNKAFVKSLSTDEFNKLSKSIDANTLVVKRCILWQKAADSIKTACLSAKTFKI